VLATIDWTLLADAPETCSAGTDGSAAGRTGAQQKGHAFQSGRRSWRQLAHFGRRIISHDGHIAKLGSTLLAQPGQRCCTRLSRWITRKTSSGLVTP
jgi:hypothetical protein